MAVADLVLGLLGQQVRELFLLLVARDGQAAIDHSIVTLNGKPLLAEEVKLLFGLQIDYHGVFEEPGSIAALT